jgi:hypothetical protein
MRQHPPPALLTPALAGVVLVAFLMSGLMTGVLAHGLVESLQPVPTATTIVQATSTAARPTSNPTATPTQPALAPTAKFDLALTAAPTHVQPGASLTLTVSATSKGAPVGNLRCTLGESLNGGTPLLSTWPPAMATDASGHATWNVTAPTQPGTYTVGVSASGGPDRYTAWGWATVYVG